MKDNIKNIYISLSRESIKMYSQVFFRPGSGANLQ